MEWTIGVASFIVIAFLTKAYSTVLFEPVINDYRYRRQNGWTKANIISRYIVFIIGATVLIFLIYAFFQGISENPPTEYIPGENYPFN